MHCNHCSRQESCESGKKKARSEKEVKRMLNRLSRIEGQVRGMKKMVEENRYCIDILIQAEAVSAAINAFNKELMSEHIRTCVAENIKAGNDEVIEELVKTLQRLMK
ncbi:MAG: metal-sensing transcriptional repressor [Firmicutes bacterium]|nr:metal-sensing transcriptional repressor [Bacillota bacterium]